MIKLKGFAPDADTHIDGVITECDAMLPMINGFRSAPTEISPGYPALATAYNGGAIVLKLNGVHRMFVGTATALYEGTSSTWDDVSRTTGGAYAAGTDDRWRFAQFGDVTLAAMKSDTLQSINSGADFADISGAPKAGLIETSAGFVMLANTSEATYGDQTDRWWCSAINNHTDWTPAVSTQCTSGRIVDAPGAITAIKRLGQDIIAYKERAIFIGRYVGPPIVWSWKQVTGDIGVLSQESLVDIGSAHFFIGYEDFYYFDGSRPVEIGSDVKEWFFNNLDKSYRHKIEGAHDRVNSLVYWFYPSSSSTAGALDKAIIYNYKTKSWGHATYDAEGRLEFITDEVTYDTLGTLYSTYEDMPDISYDSAFFQREAPVVAIFDTSHVLQTLTGAGTSLSITTGVLGQDDTMSLLKRIRPRFVQSPTSGTMTNYYTPNSGSSFSTGSTSTLTNGKHDVLRASRWHKLKFDYAGDTIMTGFQPTVIEDGME